MSREFISKGLDDFSKLKSRSPQLGMTFYPRNRRKTELPKRSPTFARFRTPLRKKKKYGSYNEVEKRHQQDQMMLNRARSTPRGSKVFRKRMPTEESTRTKLTRKKSSRGSRPSSRGSSVTKLPKIQTKHGARKPLKPRRGTPRRSKRSKRVSMLYPPKMENTVPESSKLKLPKKLKNGRSIKSTTERKPKSFPKKSIYDDYSSKYDVMARAREMDGEVDIKRKKKQYSVMKKRPVVEKKIRGVVRIEEEENDSDDDDHYLMSYYSSSNHRSRRNKKKSSLRVLRQTENISSSTKRPQSSASTTPSPSSTCSSSSSSSSNSKVMLKYNNGLVGLRNLGNTCYMNSALQSLSNTPLRNFFLSKSHTNDINLRNSTRGRVAKYFGYLMEELWSGADGSKHSPSSFKSVIERYAPMFMGYGQHDAQEFLKFLLDGIHEDLNRVKRKPKYEELKDIRGELESEKSKRWWNNYKKMNDSIIVDLFGGQFLSTLTCTKCKNVSTSYDPFFEISLPLPRSRSGWKSLFSLEDNSYSLTDCFDLFMEEEKLGGDEKPICSVCKKRRLCLKRLSLCKLPKVLCVLLKRFNSYGRKIVHDIDFPLKNLNLKSYITKDAGYSKGTNYQCIGVINHLGSLYGGHYTCYAKNSTASSWVSYNDSRVRTISSRGIKTSAAYVLLYLRSDIYKNEYS